MKKRIFLLITILFVNQHLFASFPVSTSTSKIVVNDCDIILLESGEEILVNVVEITPDLIKYRKCDREKGPLISISKEDVFMIKYHDGTKEKIKHLNSSANNTSSEYKIYKSFYIMTCLISCAFSLFVSWIIGLLLIIPAAILYALMMRAYYRT